MMNFMTVDNNRKIDRKISLVKLFDGMKVSFRPPGFDVEITGLADDSRDVKPGDLFIAVPGHVTDGRKYITEAVSLGAAAVLTTTGTDLHSGVPVVFSEDIRTDMAIIADRYFDHPSTKMTVAGITGTNGKTTTAFLLAGIYESAGKKWGLIGTVGCDLGNRFIPSGNTTPGGVNVQRYLSEMLMAGLTGCAMEVSSHALDQGRINGVTFSSATFTNLSQDHLDYHKDLDSYFAAKAKLFRDVPISIINVDDDYGRKLIEIASGKIITFGTGTDSDIRYECRKMTIKGSLLEFSYNGKDLKIEFPLPGIFNHQNAVAAAATAVGLGIPFESAVAGLKKARAVPGRLQPIVEGQPYAIFVDYAHTPDALEKLLASLRQFGPENLHLVFGCGGDRDKKKRPIMGKVASTLADYVYLTSDNPRTEDPKDIINDALKGIVDRKKCQVIEDRAMAIKAAVSRLSSGDILVISGKGHEEYQVVGNVRKYFSDIEVVKSELRKMGYAGEDRE